MSIDSVSRLFKYKLHLRVNPHALIKVSLHLFIIVCVFTTTNYEMYTPIFAEVKTEQILNDAAKRDYAEQQLKLIMNPKHSQWMGSAAFWNPKLTHHLGRNFHYYQNGKLNPMIRFYEVIENSKPIGIITLYGTTLETINIQFSKSFAPSLVGETGTQWQIHLNHQILSLVSDKTKKKLYAIPNQKPYLFEDLPKLKAMSPLLESSDIPKAMPYMKKLTVPIVQQGPYPWCWAASLSSLTQYKLKSKDTLYQITNNDPTLQGDVVNTILPAFSKYGFSPSVTPPLSIYEVKQSLIQGKPIYMLSQSTTKGHATLLCGYYSEADETYYLMMDPNRREYVICKASEFSTQYVLGGEVFKWQYTIQY